MKRNKQQKYRIKIIQELHFKKENQKILDNYVKNGYLTYKDIYPESKSYISFCILIGIRSVIDPLLYALNKL